MLPHHCNLMIQLLVPRRHAWLDCCNVNSISDQPAGFCFALPHWMWHMTYDMTFRHFSDFFSISALMMPLWLIVVMYWCMCACLSWFRGNLCFFLLFICFVLKWLQLDKNVTNHENRVTTLGQFRAISGNFGHFRGGSKLGHEYEKHDVFRGESPKTNQHY